MQCQYCQYENVEGAVFCGNCGEQVQIVCGACNTLNPPGTNFCHACGSSVNPNADSQEERQTNLHASSTARCPRCSATNDPGSTYCFNCGLPLDGATVSDSINWTSEGRTVSGEPAGFWIRFIAFIIDEILLFIGGVVLSAASGSFSGDGFTAFDFLGLVFTALYYAIGVSVWRTTIGKRILGLYVVRPDGSKLSFGRALGRYFAYFVSGIIIFIGFIMIGVRRDKRGLHDLIADTVVVKRLD